MRKIIFIIVSAVVFLPVFALAHGSAEDEAKGKEIWDNIRDKKVSCADLKDENFELLGDYFMGQMAGASHETIDQMMEQMMGEENTDLMHIVMGKRLSGCDAAAVFPQSGTGFLPMMQMMGMGNWSNPSNNAMNNMMSNFGFGTGWGWFGGIFMILFWVLLIVGIFALIKWLLSQDKEGKKGKSALDILEERYAKGEISKGEFEEKKKDLI